MQCFQEQGQPSLQFTSVELTNDCSLVSVCERGHLTHTALQEEKYELLFDMAVMALIDGYPREAATGFAAALERFYEFSTHVICMKRGVPNAAFESTWSLVDNLSERQLGGFLMAYLIETKSVPPSIQNKEPIRPDGETWKRRKWTEFRNSVIHKGYLPSTNESMAYGELVFDHIMSLSDWLIKTCPDAFASVSNSTLLERHKASNGKFFSTMSIPTMFSPTRQGSMERSFAAAVDNLKSYKQRMYQA